MDDLLVNKVRDFLTEGEKRAGEEELTKHTFSFSELYKKKDDVQKFLIPDLIPCNAVAVLIGEDGIGKTQILSQLCIEIALRRETFLGFKLNVEHGRTLLCATEDSRQKFIIAGVKQVRVIEPSYNADEIFLDFMEGSDFLDYSELIQEIRTQLKLHLYDLIVIDALSDLFTLLDGEINSNAHARRIIGSLQKICSDFNTTIILIHHAAKSKIAEKLKQGKMFLEKNDSQGAGAITQQPRTTLGLTTDSSSIKDDGTYINYLHVLKANLMGKTYVNNAIQLQFDSNTLLHTAIGFTNIQDFQKNKEEGTTPSSVANAYIKTKQQDETAKANRRKLKPNEIIRDEHIANIRKIFFGCKIYNRKDIVSKLMEVYDCGQTKVEQKDGFLIYLIDEKIILNPMYNNYTSGVDMLPVFMQPSFGTNTSNDEEDLPF